MVRKLGDKAALALRQVEILAYIALGCSHEQTAYLLGISVYTVKTYLRQVLEKLGARGRAHAVMLALLKGLLDLETLKEAEVPKELEIDWTGGPLVEQILTLIALGYHNKDISLALNYSEQYIKNIIQAISDKLGARNRVHLATLAYIHRKLDFERLGIEMATEQLSSVPISSSTSLVPDTP
ncbi:MAG TPA: helix-turn-helix transcriptional regulator [Dehalococcoidia bacterium]|nr:helix-turn-helix transcriptional regulator [Dehalococcoidia bacterium]